MTLLWVAATALATISVALRLAALPKFEFGGSALGWPIAASVRRCLRAAVFFEPSPNPVFTVVQMCNSLFIISLFFFLKFGGDIKSEIGHGNCLMRRAMADASHG